MSFLKKLEPLALLLLRCGLALVFIYHGYPKLFGSTATFIESFRAIGLPSYVVYLTGTIELFGGVALAGTLTSSRHRGQRTIVISYSRGKFGPRDKV